MGFELDEYLVGKFFKHLKKRRKVSAEDLAKTVMLSEIKPRLTILARALTGKPIEIFPAEREGGYKNNNFFLPISLAFFPTKLENLKFYLFRVLYLSIQQRLNLNWNSSENEDTLELSNQKAIETSPEILAILLDEFSIDQEYINTLKNYFISICR